jgi:hypothetical protein
VLEVRTFVVKAKSAFSLDDQSLQIPRWCDASGVLDDLIQQRFARIARDEMAGKPGDRSQGPGMVSSKSLMSNTSLPSGAAYAPRLRTCASPQSWTVIPERGSRARSDAISTAAPRKNEKGDARIRRYFSGSRWATRPSFTLTSVWIGSGRSFAGVQPACCFRGSRFRRRLPAS